MELTTHSRDAEVQRTGSASFTVPAGKRVKIETSPEGEDILDQAVPAGKEWFVQVRLEITETDAAT